jgi:hypothetical protein
MKGKEIACDAGEIIVMCGERQAELKVEERAARKHGAAAHSKATAMLPLPKAQTVAESRRAPLLALPYADKRRYFAICRRVRVPATPMGAARLNPCDRHGTGGRYRQASCPRAVCSGRGRDPNRERGLGHDQHSEDA